MRLGKADSSTGRVFQGDWPLSAAMTAPCSWIPCMGCLHSDLGAWSRWMGVEGQVRGAGEERGGRGGAGQARLPFSPSSMIQEVTPAPAVREKEESCSE